MELTSLFDNLSFDIVSERKSLLMKYSSIFMADERERIRSSKLARICLGLGLAVLSEMKYPEKISFTDSKRIMSYSGKELLIQHMDHVTKISRSIWNPDGYNSILNRIIEEFDQGDITKIYINSLFEDIAIIEPTAAIIDQDIVTIKTRSFYYLEKIDGDMKLLEKMGI